MERIEEAGRQLAEAAASPARVVLFGSHGRGEASPGSDLDFLVIEREVKSRAREMVRLRGVLPPLGVPVDVLVVTEEYAQKWADVEGTLIHSALSEGRVLAER